MRKNQFQFKMSYTFEENPDKKILKENAKALDLISRLSDAIWCFIIWCYIDSYPPRFTNNSCDDYIDTIRIWFKSATTNWLLKCKSSFWSKWVLELKNHFLGVRQSRTNMFYDILFVILELETICKGFAFFRYLDFSLSLLHIIHIELTTDCVWKRSQWMQNPFGNMIDKFTFTKEYFLSFIAMYSRIIQDWM